MAIECFVGSVGGGKSYCSVRRMLSYMGRGGRVVSNIELVGYDRDTKTLLPDSPPVAYLRDKLAWAYQDGQYSYISFDEMCDSPAWFERVPAGQSRNLRTLLVVDEATDLFDNLDRDKVRTDSTYRALFRFLRLSRHAHIDVLFICQDLSAINSRLRGLITSGWRSTDMGKYRLPFLKVLFPFDLFMLQQFDRRMEMETRREWLSKEQSIFACYRSEVFGSELGVSWDGVAISNGSIERKKKQMNILERLLLFAAVLLGLAAIFRNPSSSSASSPDYASISNLVSSVVASARFEDVSHIDPSLDPSKPSTRFLRGSMAFFKSGNGQYVLFEGSRYAVGGVYEFGRCVQILPPEFALFRDGLKTVYLMPGESSTPSPKDKAIKRALPPASF